VDRANPLQDPTPPGFDARDEALEALADVPEWQLPAEEWQEVARALQDLAAATATGDDNALIEATAKLEALSPFRLVPIDPGMPVPRSLRLRLNNLVHTLTDPPNREYTPTRSYAAAPRPRAGAAMTRQELVIHAFAPLDGPWAQSAYDELHAGWTRAQQILGATAALGEPTPPTDLPEDCTLLTAGPLLAARQRPDRTAQVVLRREHDALVLSIGWRSEPGTATPAWDELRQQWVAILGDGAELFGVVEVLLGTGEIDSRADVLSGLTDGPDDLWTGDSARWGGVTLWEIPPFDDHHRARRSILALAADRDHAELSALVWSDGSPALPPLAHYLLDAAKVRYELRVRLAAADTLRAANERGSEAELAVLASRLESMRRTVDIARSNMATVLDVSGGLFDDDRDTAAWVDQIVDDDLHYVGNARERARHTITVADFPAPVVALVTAMPEEYQAMAALLDDAREYHAENDSARYLLGTVPSGRHDQPHQVVLTMLGGTANNDAAAAVAHLVRSFPAVSQVVMVGVAAAVPAPQAPERHVRLGDIVVSTWGIVEFDHVVDRPEGVTLRQAFPRPSYLLSRSAKALEADDLGEIRPWEADLDRLVEALPTFARPAPDTDVMYTSDDPDADRVAHPDPARSGHRPGRPKVHCGRIGSANRSLRNAAVRDALAARYDMRAVEMEGSGIGWAAYAADRSWLVVRGVSDYADSRVAKSWRRYASAVAAAYTRALLGRCVQIDPQGRG